MDRCRCFLAAKNPQASLRASESIGQQFKHLESNPDIGRPLPEMPELRELLIGFGASGYVALYRHDAQADAVYVLAFRHQKESGHPQARRMPGDPAGTVA